jgi:hypothetical protein
MKKNKKGAVAIWIILSVVLVASLILFFVVNQKITTPEAPGGASAFEMQSYLDECATKAVLEATDIMLPQGGFIQPKRSVFFDGENIEYLCLNTGNYQRCVNQHPVLLREMENDIETYIELQISNCFLKMESEFRKRGGEMQLSPLSKKLKLSPSDWIDIRLKEDLIVVTIKKQVKTVYKGNTRDFEEFKVDVASPAKNLARIAVEIASQEALYGYFEYVGYSLIYDDYDVKHFNLADSTEIYTIIHKDSGKKMNIAIRGVAIPWGI